MNIISEHGFRIDGRKPHQILYTQADGSAYLEQGNTKVYSLIEDRCVVNCQYSMATFSTNERKVTDKLLSFETAILVENYPHAQIDIFCELLITWIVWFIACL
uniref:Uncharacterized protein n=1 Tax=Parascaris equorum TaxID=6256 RepID=A0A914RH88_PAREQ